MATNDPEYMARWRAANRDKMRAAQARWRAKNPEVARRNHLRRKFGITMERYDEMLAEQNGCCAICGTDKPGGRSKHFHVDHDHASDVVRKLLCHNCNRGLGYFHDDAGLLRKALDYLA